MKWSRRSLSLAINFASPGKEAGKKQKGEKKGEGRITFRSIRRFILEATEYDPRIHGRGAIHQEDFHSVFHPAFSTLP